MNEFTRALNECARRGVAIDVAIDVDVVRRSRSRSRSRSRRARVRRTLAVDAPRAIEWRHRNASGETANPRHRRGRDARTRAAPTRGTTTARSRDLVKR
jgi:hypothetical protein